MTEFGQWGHTAAVPRTKLGGNRVTEVQQIFQGVHGLIATSRVWLKGTRRGTGAQAIVFLTRLKITWARHPELDHRRIAM